MKKIDLSNPCVLDIECARWVEFVIGCVMVNGEPWTSTNEDYLFDYLLKKCRGQLVWAHAAGRYDGLWALRHAIKRGLPWSAISAAGAIISIEIGEKDEAVTICDSYRLWPDKLSRIGELLGLPKLEVGLPCICSKRCGGYCSIDHQHASRIRPYLIRDCEVLVKALRWIGDLCARHDIPLRRTVGATAWADAQEMLELPSADKLYDVQQSLLLRQGAYGGRCEVYRIRAPLVYLYDIHSAYPWGLATTPVSFTAPDYKRRIEIDRAGVYWCTVNVPEMDLPCLPISMDNGLRWVYGTLTGAWTHHELLYAVSLGAKIETIHSSATWTDERVWFDGWLKARADLRKQYGYRSAEGEWIKWVVNSFIGKTLQHPIRETVVAGEPPCVCKRGYACECREALDPEGRFWTRKRSRVAPSGHPMVNAMVTSVVRVEGHKQMTVTNGGRAYIDTDGIATTIKVNRRLGPEVGEWGHDSDTDVLQNWFAPAPKVYTGDAARIPLATKYRAKGVPVRDEFAWHAYTCSEPDCPTCKEHGRGVEIDGVKGLQSALRNGDDVFARREIQRRQLKQMGRLIGSRLVTGDVTRSLSIDEYKGLALRRNVAR